jgi:hypothetical protein
MVFMPEGSYKDAMEKLNFSDDFNEKTAALLVNSNQIKKHKRNVKRFLIVFAEIAACCALLFLGSRTLTSFINTLSSQTETIGIQTSTIFSTQSQPTTSARRSVVISSDYPQGLTASYKSPEQGQVGRDLGIQAALADPRNGNRYFYLQIQVFSAESYSNKMGDYIYNGRTIAEWQDLVDLSNGTYPYSEYNGDHGGKVTRQEWQQKQVEAKTLSAQVNCDAAKAEYQRQVYPLVVAAQASCEKRESERLKKLGYDVSLRQTWSHLNASEKQYHTILAGLLTQNQIIAFPAQSDTGYFLDWVHDGDGIVDFVE